MQIVAGDPGEISNLPTGVFDPSRVEFLAALSRALLAQPRVRALPDLMTFAFWSRRANLVKSAESFQGPLRMGLGLSFHICPANVPINSAFSMAFGLLAGNTCVVRLPSKPSESLDLFVEAVRGLLDGPHQALAQELVLTHFQRDDDVNRFWLSVADGRIFWGGDETVQHMRSLPSRAHSREVAFSDRYSLCVIAPQAVLGLDDAGLEALAVALFNDLYRMDQAACSSPQLVVWVGAAPAVASAKQRLWPAVVRVAKARYQLQAVQVIDKLVEACRHAVNNEQVKDVERHSNLLYRIELSGVSAHQDDRRGHFGTIHEVTFDSLGPLAPIVNERYQTLTYFGLSPKIIQEFIVSSRLRGIDRVVPIGNALNMGLVWDGYDLIASLSRLVDIQESPGA